METAVTFFLGVIVGSTATIIYGLFQVKKAKVQLDKAREDFLGELEKETEKLKVNMKSVTDRLNQAQAITNQQLELLGQIDQPSKNALHSRYKNELNAEVRKLEEDKLMILNSILKDGYDPTLTIRTPQGTQEKLKLSAYLANNGVLDKIPEENKDSDNKDPNGPRKVGKFVVYNGGNDGTTH